MGVDGPVVSGAVYYLPPRPDEYVDCVEVLSVHLDSEHVSSLPSFVSGELTLLGIALWACASPCHQVDDSHDFEYELMATAKPIALGLNGIAGG